MFTRSRRRWARRASGLVATLLLAAAACGDDDDAVDTTAGAPETSAQAGADTTAASPESSAEPSTETSPAPSTESSAPEATETSAAASDTSASAAGGATIGVSFYDNQIIPLYIDMESGMQQAADELGAEISFSYANFDPAAQVSQIEQFITQQVDVILATPFDRNALLPAYEAAREAGIPIISFANKVDDEDEDLFVGRDWSEMGALEMEAIAEALGGEGQVALISGPPEIDVARQVSEGWQSVIDANPGLELVATLTDPDMSREVGLDLANTLLASNPEVDAIACTIDQICLGAVQAIEEQGLSQEDVFIASLDADAEAVEQVQAGTGIDFTIAMKGETWGRQVVQVAVDYLAGNVPDSHMVESEFLVIDAESAASITPEDLK